MNEFELIATILRDLEIRVSLLESSNCAGDCGKECRELLDRLDAVVVSMTDTLIIRQSTGGVY